MAKRSNFAVVLSFAVMSSIARAENAAQPIVAPESASDMTTLSNWPVIIFTLFFIVAMIVCLGWLARRFSGMGTTGASQMKVLSAIPVGTRERIALIDVHGKQLVVGVTQNNINLLHAFEEPLDLSASNSQSEFSQKLSSLLLKSGAKIDSDNNATKTPQSSHKAAEDKGVDA